jgi:hypothetical protein
MGSALSVRTFIDFTIGPIETIEPCPYSGFFRGNRAASGAPHLSGSHEACRHGIFCLEAEPSSCHSMQLLLSPCQTPHRLTPAMNPGNAANRSASLSNESAAPSLSPHAPSLSDLFQPSLALPAFSCNGPASPHLIHPLLASAARATKHQQLALHSPEYGGGSRSGVGGGGGCGDAPGGGSKAPQELHRVLRPPANPWHRW